MKKKTDVPGKGENLRSDLIEATRQTVKAPVLPPVKKKTPLAQMRPLQMHLLPISCLCRKSKLPLSGMVYGPLEIQESSA